MCYNVPDLTSNFFSVRATTTNGNIVSFGHKCWIRNNKKQHVGTGSPAGKLYKLNCKVMWSLKEEANIAGEKEASKQGNRSMAQETIAHVNTGQIHQLDTNAEGIDIPLKGNPSFCEACIQEKMHCLPHSPLKEIRSTELKAATSVHRCV